MAKPCLYIWKNHRGVPSFNMFMPPFTMGTINFVNDVQCLSTINGKSPKSMEVKILGKVV